MEWPISWEDVKRRIEALENGAACFPCVELSITDLDFDGDNTTFAYLSMDASAKFTEISNKSKMPILVSLNMGTTVSVIVMNRIFDIDVNLYTYRGFETDGTTIDISGPQAGLDGKWTLNFYMLET